ncbi:MAG: LptF/LptG family permease [Pseudomonadota bacterium]
MTLDFYIVLRFARSLGLVFCVVLVLVLTVDTLDVLGSIRSETIGILDAVWLSSLRVPDIIVTVFPLIILIASMIFCMGLTKSSEFVIVRAVGRPILAALLGPIVLTALIAFAVVISLGPWAGRTILQFDSARAQFSNNLENRLQVTSSGLWLREANDDQITVLNAAGSAQNGRRLEDVTLFRFSTDGRLTERFEAQNAFLNNGDLILSNAKVWDFTKIVENPELTATTRGVLRISTTLSADQIVAGQPQAKTLSIWDLPKEIDTLERSGSSSLSHRSHYFSQLAAPILYVAMFLIGAIFTVQSGRVGNRGLAVIGAVSLGFFLFFFQRTAQTFGEVGEVPLFIATWSPPLAALLGGLAWLLRCEDG